MKNSQIQKSEMYIVGEVSEQVTGNYIAWSNEISTHKTLSEARKAAQSQPKVDGYIVIIHDGENYY